MVETGTVSSDTTIERTMPLTANQFRQGATAPTEVTVGTTPTIPALLMDAVNELLTVGIERPPDWEVGTDITFDIFFELVVGETNGDTLDITYDHIVAQIGSTGGGSGKTSTQTTAQVTVTTAEGLAAGDRYTIECILLAADADNPLDANFQQAHVEFHLTNVTGVGAIHITGGRVRYEGAY